MGNNGKYIFERIHSCKWNTPERIFSNFTLLKIKGDLTSENLDGSFNLVYFDAFGPDKQPEMWTDDIFEKIAGVTEQGGILVTYSAKGSVKRALKKNGFEVSLLAGPPGKRQIIRAVKM
jgi:tRNA U34 5-methylaminomethyl-2-thiouridine-forming methyltransferase MnmC